MALRNRAINLPVSNQENVKNAKSAVIPGQIRRAALGEIGNKVISRKNDLIGKSGLQLRDNKLKPTDEKEILGKVDKAEKVSEKETIKVDKVSVTHTKPEIKNEILTAKCDTEAAVCIKETDHSAAQKESDLDALKKETDSFSSDLITIEDIDEEDRKNPILVSVYSNDIYAYLRNLEMQFPIEKEYLQGQEVTSKMRSVLIDWLIEVHEQFHLMQETLYLTVSIIDRFLQTYRHITRKKLQLVGVTAMFIASKYEEMYSPDIGDFVYITDNAYSKVEILHMEMLMLKSLNFSFGRPLPLHFLRRYSKAGKALPMHHTLAKYFLEQCLVNYEVCHHPPSLIAAAAIYLSFLLIGNDNGEEENNAIWTKTLIHYSTYKPCEVLPVVQEIANIICNSEKSKYQAVRRKYTNSKHMKISLRPELKSPTLYNLANARKE